MQRGKLITIEGICGIGKTKCFNELKESDNLSDTLFNDEINDKCTDEYNKRIFEILTSKKSRFFETGNPKMEALLICAKQTNDEESFVIPALNNYKNVISDRGFDTVCITEGIKMSKKYGFSEKESIMKLYEYLSFFCIIPDKTILLTGNVDNSITRAEKRDEKKYTPDEIYIIKRTAYWFSFMAKKFKERFIVIDADLCDTKKEIIKILKEM